MNTDRVMHRPKRTLLAYCALAERLGRPGVGFTEALTPFFAEICKPLTGQFFDASLFSSALEQRFGLKIPRLAILGFTEQLASARLFVNTATGNTGPFIDTRNSLRKTSSVLPCQLPKVKSSEFSLISSNIVNLMSYCMALMK
ncbi:hypothetical protein [Alcaligenes faecalis]|uniref:hypothetical protein n=1 Tax=Alcaligenes faecalis TaxID=511 RepID=UPI0024BD0CE3|nr:hypothetical protein [Alcaligenes faecalis]WHQ45823.1 hypothetical protein E8D21_19365 [Alcaligenes faecalis]WHQ45969.1 hypothetical protein E8D21_20215 [Alcaligenes faecalis]